MGPHNSTQSKASNAYDHGQENKPRGGGQCQAQPKERGTPCVPCSDRCACKGDRGHEQRGADDVVGLHPDLHDDEGREQKREGRQPCGAWT